MGPVFIHAERRGEGAAADQRNAGNLQKPLDCAVLPVFSMEHGKGEINLLKNVFSIRQFQKATDGAALGKGHRI